MSTHPKRSAYQTSVVTRLRATFLFLALVSCGATAFAIWQLSSLDRSHARLVESAVPTLRQTHDVQGQLSRVLELASRAARGQSSEELKTLQDQLSEITEAIRTAIDSETWPEHTRLTRTQIENLLEALQKIQADGVARRAAVLKIDANLSKHWEHLRQNRANFRELIEPLLIESATELELADQQPVQANASSSSDRQVAISNQVIKQMNLTQIGYRFSALIDTTEKQLGDMPDQPATEWAKRLRFEFSGVMQVLIRLPADPARAQLAIELANTRELLFSDTGLVSLMKLRALENGALQQTTSQRLAIVSSINTHADELVAMAATDADKAAVDFREDLTGALTVLAITITIVLLVLGTVWILVVERQISRRMSRLTETVSAIADGDIDTPVDLTGHDELSKMGAALEVFKSNATELRRSNEELESFAYAAAHDMRSPLRAIENLAQWTLEDAGDELPEICRKNLEKLLSRANRLSKLQADLLDYSRVGKANSEYRPLDLQILVQNIQELLDVNERFRFDIDVPQTQVVVAEIPLRQILINLMTNAVKHHDRAAGEISIKARLTEDCLIVSVSDDGPGIEPQFHDRIFKLFQTLQSRDHVEGSGLGLSFVLKQVNRFGGDIKVISDPSSRRGTSFVFDLPAKKIATDFDDTVPLPGPSEQAGVTAPI